MEARNKPQQELLKVQPNPRKIQKVFYIPDIYLVGYGRTQSYQICCLSCKNPFFQINEEKSVENLFCDCCKIDLSLIADERISPAYVIGFVVGWILKTPRSSLKKTRKNYKKIYEMHKYTCLYCGYNLQNSDKFLPLHIDPIQYLPTNGLNKIENLAVSCSECKLISSGKLFYNFEDKRDYINFEKEKKQGNIP